MKLGDQAEDSVGSIRRGRRREGRMAEATRVQLRTVEGKVWS